jgi:hypothetical protein
VLAGFRAGENAPDVDALELYKAHEVFGEAVP